MVRRTEGGKMRGRDGEGERNARGRTTDGDGNQWDLVTSLVMV
jgi:hypothetical protein